MNWTKVCFLLVSCSAPLTECSPFPHHNYPSSLPSTSLTLTTHTLGNNVYGGGGGQHSYSQSSKGPWGSSYQSVSRTFTHKPWAEKPHKPLHHKPVWTQKPAWTQKPVWTQKPTEKPWVYPTHPPSKPTPTPPVTTPPPTAPPTTPPSPTTTLKPSTTPSPSPLPDFESEYFPFPSPLEPVPLEDIDLPAGPPAILRPGTRSATLQLYSPGSPYFGTYPQPFYSQFIVI